MESYFFFWSGGGRSIEISANVTEGIRGSSLLHSRF